MTTGERRFSAGRWLRCARPNAGAATVLVCFPHAGGSATFFRSWGRQLPNAVEVLAVQYPGRLDRLKEACLDDVHQLADGVVGALAEHRARTVALFGHSLGAAVAFEVANRLQAQGTVLRGLFVSSHGAPRGDVKGAPCELSDAALLAELRRFGATPSAVIDQPEMNALVLPSLRSDYRAATTYQPRPGPLLTCPVVALVGDNDPDVTLTDVQRWAAVTTGPFTMRVFPGDHFYLVPSAPKVLSQIWDHLQVGGDRSMAATPGTDD